MGGGLFFLAFERLKWSKLVGFELGNDSQISSDSHHVASVLGGLAIAGSSTTGLPVTLESERRSLSAR